MTLPHRSPDVRKRMLAAPITPRSIFSYWKITWRRLLAVFGAPLLVLLIGVIAYGGTSRIAAARADVVRSREVTDAADAMVSQLTDAETSQRGFLITGNDDYLSPYLRAADSLPLSTARLRHAIAAAGSSAATWLEVDSLVRFSDVKMAELAETIRLRRAEGAGAALALVRTNRGEDAMRAARRLASSVRHDEAQRLAARTAVETRYTREVTLIVLIGTGLAFLIALFVNVLLAREAAMQTRLAAERDAALGTATAANDQLEQQSIELQNQAQELEASNEELVASNEELQATTEELEEQTAIAENARSEASSSNARLRESEAKLVLSMEAGGLGSWEWDVAADRVVWSPQTERMHGLAEGTFSGTREEFASYIHPDDRERVGREIARTLAERIPTYYIKYRFIRGDGAVRWLEGFARLETDGDGNPASFLGVSHDVTEREEMLEAEQQARREAEAANAAKAIFLTTMSHELRTPLNAVSGYVDLLEMGVRGPITDAQREDLRRIRRASQHLLALINDILNYARLEAGKIEIHLSTVTLADALSEMEALIAPQLESKGVRYEYRACDASVRVRADREKLDQILLNLVGNAVKFTDAGGSITLHCAQADGRAQVIVADTGRGIPRGKLESIFDPFVQVDRHLTPERQQGVGLGLAISRDLARAMHGDITVQSDMGKGATFVLWLPLAEPSRASGPLGKVESVQ